MLTLDSPEHHEVGEQAGSMKLAQAFVGYIYLGSTQEVQVANANVAAEAGMLTDLLVD